MGSTTGSKQKRRAPQAKKQNGGRDINYPRLKREGVPHRPDAEEVGTTGRKQKR